MSSRTSFPDVSAGVPRTKPRIPVSAWILLCLLLGGTSFAQREIPVGSLDEIPAPGSRGGLLLSSDGHGFLAAWTDSRSVPSGYAARLSPDGEVIDRLGIRLPFRPTELAWDGVNYVVSDRAFAARVRPDGTVLDPVPRQVVPTNLYALGFATNGPISISLYRAVDETWRVAPLSRELTSIGASISLPLPDPQYSHFPVGVGALPDGTFLVLVTSGWHMCPSGCSILGFQVDAAEARVVRQFTIPPSTDVVGETAYRFAVGTASFTIATFSYESRTIVSRTFDFDGSPLASTVLFKFPAATYAAPPDIATVDHGFLVSFSEYQEDRVTNRFARLDETGRWDGSFVVHDGGARRAQPLVTWSGATTLVAFARRWFPPEDTNFDVGLMTPTGEPGELRMLAYSLVPASAVAIASNGPVDLVLFSTGWYGHGYELRAATVGPDGQEHAPGALVTSGLPREGSASVVPSPGGFLITWLDGETILSRRISLSGEWIDPAPRTVASDVCWLSNQALAPFGSGLALAYSTCSSRIMLERLDSQGLPSGEPGQLAETEELVYSPVIASGDGAQLVVWQFEPRFNCPITCYYPPPGLRAALIGADGSPRGDTFDLTPPGAGSYTPPAVTWTGSNYLVAWGKDRAVWALRVAGDGALLDAFGGEQLTSQGEVADPRPALGVDGSRVLAFWSDNRGVQEVLRALPIDVSRPLVDQLGTETATLSSGHYRGYSSPPVSVTSPGTRTLALLYSRVDLDPFYGGVSRVFTRRLVDLPRVRPVRRPTRQ